MLDMPAGPRFVDAMQRAWDNGDAVFPLDQRLPLPARDEIIGIMAPSVVIDASGQTARLADGRPVESGDALVVATSGSGGTPKGVVLTHDAVAASAAATSAGLGIDPDDHWLACLPLSHMGGLSVITRALALDLPLTVHEGFHADRVREAAAAGCTLVSLVPTTLARIDPTIFRRIVVGGSTPPADRPANVIATYGMTETGSGIVYEGRALDGVDLKIVEGEIHVRGPMLLRCYRNDVDPKDADGWFATGDLGEISTDGQLTVAGRQGDLIITGGENVWPDVVERRLMTHPAIADVCVAGEPDAEWGERVVAYVVAREASTLDLDDLRDHVRAELPAFCAPREIVSVSSLPRTSLGKVRRGDLRSLRSQHTA
jgi:o-succinylbenzoate---CoA ligase